MIKIFLPCLTVLFIALKLLDKIDWSWWWVVSPMLLPLILILVLLVIILGCKIIYLLVRKYKKEQL